MTRPTRALRRLTVLAGAAALCTGFAACGSSDDSSTSSSAGTGDTASSGSTDPIKVGSINALTGPFQLADASNGAKALFDRVNAEGGVNGRKIDFIIKDDKSDPAAAATAARELIQQDDVVGMTGGVTLVGCTVNQKLLERSDIRDVMAGGAVPSCFQQPNVSPVNAGPQTDITLSVQFAHDKLGAQNVCLFLTDSPPTKSYLDALKADVTQILGKEPYIDATITENTNYASLMTKAKSEQCDAIINDGSPPQAIPLAKARDQQGVTAPLILQGSSYVSDLPDALGPDVTDIYAVSEMEPYTLDSPVLKQLKSDFEKNGVKLTSLAQYGWQAANVYVEMLKSIKGEINKDSVNKALLALENLDSHGMTGSPYTFGPGKTHNSNRSVKFVEVKNGDWVSEGDWVTLPAGLGTDAG
jgi:branched-chain amino acid transport system substrate-binding protein